MSTGRPHHYGHLLHVWKVSRQPVTLYTAFHDLINVYSHRSGADNPRGQNFDVNRNLLSLRSFATSLKKISLKSDFIQIFSWFYTCIYSPGAEADPFRDEIWCQQEHLVTSLIYCKFKKNPFEVWFYTNFFTISYMYIAPWQGTKFWCQRKCLVTSFICCKFKNNVFEVWFYTIFFMI